jgi:hypothetical protein
VVTYRGDREGRRDQSQHGVDSEATSDACRKAFRVTFGYQPDLPPVHVDVSFDIPAGSYERLRRIIRSGNTTVSR